MKLATFKLLKKFMAMTTSSNEFEAAGGMKAANQLLEREGLTWERVLDRSCRVIQEVEPAPEDYAEPAYVERSPAKGTVRDTVTYDVKEVDDVIAIIEQRANLKGDFEDLITSIIEQHRGGKRLSLKQRELLLRVSKQ